MMCRRRVNKLNLYLDKREVLLVEPHLGLVSKNTEILKGSYVKFGGAPVPYVLLDVQVAAVARSAISPALADL